jgi:prolyl oligopeptidase
MLIRIETKAGHGAGKPTAKLIEEVADLWAFLVKELEFKPTIGGWAQGASVPPTGHGGTP